MINARQPRKKTAASSSSPTAPPPPLAIPSSATVTSPKKATARSQKKAAAPSPSPLPSKTKTATAKKKVASQLTKPTASTSAQTPSVPPPPAPRHSPVKTKKKTAPARQSKRPSSTVTPAQREALKVLFVASECTPLAKTGGLGDVVMGLSKALRTLGHDVRILLPLYASIPREKYQIHFYRSACIHMGNQEEQWVGVYQTTLEGVTVWLLECDRFFGRSGIYHDSSGEYGDNAFRFALLSKAALQICKDVDFIPDVMHAHDWPTALVPAYLKTWDRILSPLSATASVLTIHNIGYQGVYHPSALGYIGLGQEHFTADKLEDHGRLNLLKAGIHFADKLTTVSPRHAEEIKEPIGSCGLAPFLQHRQADLRGILNGADYDTWNPEKDPLIPARFSVSDMRGKSVCKMKLQERFQLEMRPNWPVFGIVSRFAHQKGFDLLREALPRALNDMIMQVVVLGSGDAHTEDFFRWLSSAYPGRVNAHIGFSEEISHWIEAGSDFFLMPSLYEPCGLNQMYSMKYGTLPIVRATGGLDDTVENYQESTGQGTGFKFWDPNALGVYYTIGWAVATWFDRPHHIDQMRRQAMKQTFSWIQAAKQYVSVYQEAIQKRRALLA